MSAYFRVNATFSHVTVTAICFVRRAPTFDVRFDATSNYFTAFSPSWTFYERRRVASSTGPSIFKLCVIRLNLAILVQPCEIDWKRDEIGQNTLIRVILNYIERIL